MLRCLRTTACGAFALAFTLTASTVATTAAAQPPADAAAKGAIAGRVLSASGALATDARVSLVDLHRRGAVDVDARFRFDDVPPGTYLVEAVSRRYGTGVGAADVTAGGVAELEIRLDLASQVDEIVVSAGPDAKSRLELAQPVSVLAGEELALRAQSSLGETLAEEPGVSSTYFGPGASRPVIRGLGGDRVRMLEDGIGTTDVSSTSPDHAVGVEPSTAESIEVVRGPATLLYGSSAVGGVVNVVGGRIPHFPIGEKVSGTVELRGASANDERTGSLTLEGGAGDWAWHLDGLRRTTNDLATPAGDVANSDVETTSTGLGVTRFFGDRGLLGVAWGGFDTNYGLPGGEQEETRIDLRQRRLDLRGELLPKGGPFEAAKLRLGVSDYQHQELEGGEVGTTFLNDEWEGRLELVQRRRGRWSGSSGVQASDRDLEAIGDEAFLPPSTTRNRALFTFQEWDLGPVLVDAGGRFESSDVEVAAPLPSRTFDGLSASVGVVWKIDEHHSLAVSLARSTKLPNGEELFSEGVHVATRSFELGNPDLGEETSLGLDVSLRREAGRFSGELNLFANRFDDFIYQSFTGDEVEGFPVLRYEQADADFEGAEAQGRVEVWRAGETHVDLQLFGDLVRAELRATGEPLPRIPPLSYGAGVHVHNDRLHASLELRRTSAQDRLAFDETRTDGYTLVNASLSYRLYRGSFVYDVLLRGTNLTDELARNHVSLLKDEVPLPGRDLGLSLRMRF